MNPEIRLLESALASARGHARTMIQEALAQARLRAAGGLTAAEIDKLRHL